MPSTYAHYRFGKTLLAALPGDVRRTILRFPQLFEVGLHGPDIFYYHAPLLKTNAGFLGIKFHEQTGQAFFLRVCRAIRLERSEAALSYLYGVCLHYCLDSTFQSFVGEQAALLGIPAGEIETEFDRFLLESDGKVPPCSQDLSAHLKLTPGECETVAKFYPPATARNIRDSLRSMGVVLRLLTAPEGARRKVLEKGIDVIASEYRSMIMTSGPNPRCASLDSPLLALYRTAEEKFPQMLSQLQSHITYNAPLGAEFDPAFS